MAGSRLTFLFDNAVLSKILVCLLPLGMLATLLPKKDLTHNGQVEHGLRLWLLTPLVCFCIGAHDGFYGPGTGSFLILALHFIVRVGLIQASATVLNLASNTSAAVVFVLAGKVAWTLALPWPQAPSSATGWEPHGHPRGTAGRAPLSHHFPRSALLHPALRILCGPLGTMPTAGARFGNAPDEERFRANTP